MPGASNWVPMEVVSGDVQRRMGPLFPEDGQDPQFMAFGILDPKGQEFDRNFKGMLVRL